MDFNDYEDLNQLYPLDSNDALYCPDLIYDYEGCYPDER